MRRTSLTLILVSLLSALPRIAVAEPEAASQQSCETVTTVRCTGAAAPLALPGSVAAQPTPPLIPAPMVPAPQPVYPPAPQAAYPPPPSSAYPIAPAEGCATCSPYASPAPRPAGTLPGGWQLALDEHGAPVYERKLRRTSPGLWVPGLILWMGTYLGTGIGGVYDERPWTMIPFFGGIGAGAADMLDGDLGRGFGYTMGGLLQVTGFIMFVAGASGSTKLERLPVRVAPLAFREGGGGMSLAARF